MAVRGIYWNFAFSATVDNNGQLVASQAAFLTRLNIGRVHLWLNDQPSPAPAYTRNFAYGADWSAQNVTAAVDAFHRSGIAVVLTLSPWFQTREYLEELGKPLAGATMRPNVEIEFDLEGILGGYVLPATDPILSQQDAHQLLLDVTSQAAPGVPFGLSTPRRYFQAHRQLILKAAWIAPQSYNAGDVATDYAAIIALRADIEIRFAIDCESFGGDRVSLATFKANLIEATTMQNNHNGQVTGHVIWSRFALQQGYFPAERVQVNGQPYIDVLGASPVG